MSSREFRRFASAGDDPCHSRNSRQEERTNIQGKKADIDQRGIVLDLDNIQANANDVYSRLDPMTTRVDEFDRVVARVCVSVKVLRICAIRHDAIRLHEPAQRRVVPPRAIVVQPDCTLFPLPREMVRRRRRAVGVAARAIRLVANLGRARAAAVGGDRGAAAEPTCAPSPCCSSGLDARREQSLWSPMTRGLARVKHNSPALPLAPRGLA